jgi:acyl-CoA thioester hydrolase
MLQSEVQIRVRYGEVDRMGYLHHGNYPLYFEVGRTELIRQLGLSYKEMEDKGILMPVRDLQVKYYLPVLYDQEVTLVTRLAKKPEVKVVFEYQLISDTGQLHSDAKTTLVFVDANNRKPIRAPEFFNRLVEPYFK